MVKRSSETIKIAEKYFCCCCNISWNFIHLNTIQLYGMMVLCFTLMKRRWFMHVCYLAIPIIGFTYVYIMDDLTQSYLKPNLDETLRRDSPFGSPHEVQLRTFTLSEIQNYLARNIDSHGGIPTKLLYTTSEDSDLTNKEVDHFFDMYGMMDLSYEITFPNLNNTKTKGVVMVRPMKESEEEVDDELYDSLKSEEFDETTPNQYIGSITMKRLEGDSISYTVEYEQKMERKMPSATIQSSILSLKNNYSTFSSFCKTVGVYGHTFECENFLSSSLIHFVDSAFILQQSGTIVKSRVGQLPYHSDSFDFNFNRGDRRLIFFLPLMLLTVLSLYIWMVISDKENGSRSLLDLMGLRLQNYLIAKYVSFFSYYIVFAGLCYLYGLLILQSRIFTQVDFFVVWILLFGGGLLTISFAFLFSTFFKSNKTALIPGHIVVYILPGFMSVIHFQVAERGVWYWKPLCFIYPWPLVDALMTLFEPVAEKKIFLHFDHLYKDWDFGFAVFSLYFVAVLYFVLYLYLEKVLPQNFTVRKHPFFCCAWIKKLFCCCCVVYKKSLTKYYRNHIKTVEQQQEEEEEEEKDKEDKDKDVYFEEDDENEIIDEFYEYEDQVLSTKEKDDDVERIEKEISGVKDVSQFGIMTRKLTKRYTKNGKYAVDGISFRVPRNSLYGLLGENGAGKTTTIRILIGELSPTDGDGFINGMSVKNQLAQIRKSVGVCHQHNVLWPEMSVEEHLFLYARIRGVDFIKQKEHVSRILRETELIHETSNPRYFFEEGEDGLFLRRQEDHEDDDQKKIGISKLLFNYFCCLCVPCLHYLVKPCRKVRDLSAGTKRKLSLAIALCGNPSTIFLDEPTTGLDPKTKNHIWKIILDLKASKSIILTTHEMLEAEVLCDEIGIMKDGEFVATGTSLHLKNKFGKGYRLKIIRNVVNEEEEREQQKILLQSISSDPNNTSTFEEPPPLLLTSKEKIIQFIYTLTTSCEEEPTIIISKQNHQQQQLQQIKKKLVLDFGNTLIWELSFPSNFLLSHFFEEIERRKNEIGIKDWSLNQCNLNDVFVKLIGKDQVTAQDEKDQMEELIHHNQEMQIEIQRLKDHIILQNQQQQQQQQMDNHTETETEESNEDKFLEEVITIDDEKKKEELSFLRTPSMSPPPPQTLRSFYSTKQHQEEEARRRMEERDFSDLFEKNCFIIFLTQLYVLIKKEVLLAYRSPIWTTLNIFFASIVVFQLWVVFSTGTIKDSKHYFISSKDRHSFGTLFSLECVTWVRNEDGLQEKCFHMIYTTNSHPLGEKIIQYISEKVGEEFPDIEFKTLSFPDSTKLLQWSTNHPNQTCHALMIHPQSSLSVPPNPVPYPYVEYTVLHNSTSLDSPNNDLPLSMTGYVQILVDEAILFARTGRKVSIEVDRRAAPKYPLKEKHCLYDVFMQLGPCFFAVAFTFIVTQSSHVFVAMKEIGLHRHLIRSGVVRLALYCSYAFYFCFLSIVNGIVTYIVSVLFEIDIVRNTNPVIVISLLILYSFALLATISITFPFLQSEKNAQAVNTIFMLLVFFTSFLFDAAVLYSIYESASGWGAFMLYFVLPVLFAPINFCKIYSDFSYKSIPLFDYNTKEYKANDGYGFDDLFVQNRFDELSLETGPTFYWFLYLIVNCVLYVLLGLFIYVCVESYFYDFEYYVWKWLCFWNHNETIKNKNDLPHRIKHKKQRELQEEEKRKEMEIMDPLFHFHQYSDKNSRTTTTIIEEEEDLSNFSVYFENLTKSFISLFPTIRSHPVLDNITLSMPKNRLMGILGPNGAGKSTLVNLISGTLKITDGEIYVTNDVKNKSKKNQQQQQQQQPFLRVKKNIGNVRKLLGMVPQNDILIEKLRAKEMLELFAICKRIKIKHLGKKITKILDRVGLSNAINDKYVGNFSGGMKRKLSIAMSLIGEPSLILLDEPTTGIDVYSCYQIWKLFYEIKKHRSIILTSHKMSETELLSDNIAILHEKKFRIQGEPLELKEKFGSGYVLQIVLKEPVEEGLEKMNELIQQTILSLQNNEDFEQENIVFPKITQNGRNVNYSVENKILLSKILKGVEDMKAEEKETKKFIESFGISQCTLESIYMKVTLNKM